MITLEDCLGMANLDKDEVSEIARHERMTYMAALEKGAALLNDPWGDAAIRQMVWDNLCAANRHHPDHVAALMMLYRDTCDRHPNPCDRRRSPLRESAPVRRH